MFNYISLPLENSLMWGALQSDQLQIPISYPCFCISDKMGFFSISQTDMVYELLRTSTEYPFYSPPKIHRLESMMPSFSSYLLKNLEWKFSHYISLSLSHLFAHFGKLQNWEFFKHCKNQAFSWMEGHGPKSILNRVTWGGCVDKLQCIIYLCQV
jgi:hypothetical protein